MGKPTRFSSLVLLAEYIGEEEVTGGTETSQYPEEEKSNEIPQVVASERGYRAILRKRKGRDCGGKPGDDELLYRAA